MKNKKMLILRCVLILLLIATISLIVFVEVSGRLNESKTTKLVATVTAVSYDDFEKQNVIEIYTEEFDNSFLISTIVTTNIDFDTFEKITSIKKDATVYFKIENSKAMHINKVEFIDVVSLSTAETEIFSIDDYNEYHRKVSLPGKLICVFIMITAVIGLLIMWIKNRRHHDV